MHLCCAALRRQFVDLGGVWPRFSVADPLPCELLSNPNLYGVHLLRCLLLDVHGPCDPCCIAVRVARETSEDVEGQSVITLTFSRAKSSSNPPMPSGSGADGSWTSRFIVICMFQIPEGASQSSGLWLSHGRRPLSASSVPFSSSQPVASASQSALGSQSPSPQTKPAQA